MFLLPDLIPVPLQLEDVRKTRDSIFFTIGFRSGDGHCSATLIKDSIKGWLHKEGMESSPFWLARSETNLEFKGREKPAKESPVIISTHAETNSEVATKRRLQRILKTYDLEKYLYTKDIKIQDSIIPHSHPVLTLSTNLTNDTALLSTFLHEQMHWFTLSKNKGFEPIADSILKWYPRVPIDLPEGAGTEQGTYVHIMVNYLEFHCLINVIGQEAALQHMQFMCTQHYTWVYETVLEDYDQLASLATTYQLHP